ncbi:MAG: HAMP domain-containing histidine kinase [Clostridia bacterium]|nr:HAMP domain-containing histidine kinase [Clostridia bacterium]
MKWKITGRFLAAILITVLVVSYCLVAFNFISSFIYFFKNKDNVVKYYGKSVNPSEFFHNFRQNIELKDGKIYIDSKYIDNLKENQLWIQILNENGTEVYSRFKPSNFPYHYIPGELVLFNSQSGTIKGSTLYTGIFESGKRKFTYIIGFPSLKTDRITFYFSHTTIFWDIAKIILGVILTITVVSILSGYVFSRWLANPIVSIIEEIKILASGNYSRRYKTCGLYKDVYSSLDNLSHALSAIESERAKTEKMREEWIANITHDIRTPLSSIKGYSEILLDPAYNLSTEEQKKYAEVISNKTNYIGNLIDDLKLTYQLKTSLNLPDMRAENLIDIVRDTVIDILNHPEYEDAEITLDHQEESIMFSCDCIMLRRAFTNVIYNALVHNDKGTKINISIKQDDLIAIEIADNGKGIVPEDLDRLFDRYYRGTNTGEAHKGSGLGMAIAKQIIEAHKGTISVASTPGAGTKVLVRFVCK